MLKAIGRSLCQLVCMGLPLLLSISVVFAQTVGCPAFVDHALDAVGETCGALGRNQVCYGNRAVDALFDSSAPIDFADPGDRASILSLRHLTTAALRPDEDLWGVAVLALQVNLPDNLPGQNATFIVFGDAELTPDDAQSGYDAPMQAFSLATHIGGIDCAEVPDSGLLVQAPEDATVNFLVNGVEVNVGSSALFQIDGDDLTVDTVEGVVAVTSDGASEVVGEGLSVRVPRGRHPLQAALTRSQRVRNAPWRLLPRQINTFPPPPDGQIVALNQCAFPNTQRAAQNPVSVRAGEPVVLRFTIPQQSLELARIIQRQTRNQLFINGEVVAPYTRIGPWRGNEDEFGQALGIEFYWLIEAPEAGNYRIALDSQSVTGRPIVTGIDGPDPDNQPEIIPAQRRFYCLVQAQP
ncbi:MAG: hypothetical protein U0521_04195 [Anaerolineae bacterium]